MVKVFRSWQKDYGEFVVGAIVQTIEDKLCVNLVVSRSYNLCQLEKSVK